MTKLVVGVFLLLLAVVLVGLIFGGPSNGGWFWGGLREITNDGRHMPPAIEENCPHPSPGQACPWVDDGRVQPQPVWP